MGLKEDLRYLDNVVRIGHVSSVDASKYQARVIFGDRNNIVSSNLKIIKNKSCDCTPWLPSVGQLVLCVFIPKGEGDGFIVGGV